MDSIRHRRAGSGDASGENSLRDQYYTVFGASRRCARPNWLENGGRGEGPTSAPFAHRGHRSASKVIEIFVEVRGGSRPQ